LAREAGCAKAVTFQSARSLRSRSDSGTHIARALGLECAEFESRARRYPHEEAFWAALGDSQDVNLALFDYPGSLCLLFTGFHGDKIWDRAKHDVSDIAVRGDTTGLGFTEFRLIEGVFHCPVPFWGITHAGEISDISRSAEMDRWHLADRPDYDRPICRRIVEEAGVPRHAFGQHKSATTVDQGRFRWPLSPECQDGFEAYLRERGVRVPLRPLIEALNVIDREGLERLRHGLGLQVGLPVRTRASTMLFQWGNSILRAHYESGLRRRDTPGPPSA
jgi:hypothetical protein